MATEIAFKIPVDTGQAEKSVGELRAEFKALNDVINTTKIGTKEYNDALIRLGQVKGDLTDLRKNIIALDPEKKIQAFATAGASIAGGFAAAQGAIALFGGESKLVTETMVKLQAVMALTQGIQSVSQLAKEWKVLNLVMKANPYIAIAAALMALGAAFVGMAKNMGFMKTDAQKAQEAIDKLTDAYERLGKEGEFQLKLLRAKGQETFEAEEKLMLSRIDLTGQQIKLAETALKGIGIPYRDLINLFTGADDKLKESLKNAKDQQEKALQDLEILRATQTTKEENISKKESEKVDKKNEDERQKNLTFLENLRNDEMEFERTESEKDEVEFAEKTERENEKLSKEKEERDRRFQELTAEEDARRETELQKLIEEEENKRRIKQQGLANEQIISQARMSIAASSIQGLSSLGNLFISNEKALANFQKGVALADLAVNTAQAIANMIKGVEKTAAASGPAYPIVKASLYISGFATILGNMAKARQLLKSATPGSSPTLESPVLPPIPSIPTVSAPAAQTAAQSTAQAISGTQTQTTEQGFFAGFGEPIRAYVVETDITEKQKNIKAIEQKSTFP